MNSHVHSAEITEIQPAELIAAADDYTELSRRVVEAGAHLGWEAPLDPAVGKAYWLGRASRLGHDDVLFAAYQQGALVGTVQLERAHFETSRHRAEIAKLMVDPGHRRQGYASALMDALEARAAMLGVELLVLDTRPEEPVENLYRARGYAQTGLIPNWMKFRAGTYKATVFYYKLLPNAQKT